MTHDQHMDCLAATLLIGALITLALVLAAPDRHDTYWAQGMIATPVVEGSGR